MKVKPQALGKVVKTKIDRPKYLRWLRETQKFPLLIRIASQIHRSGISSARFFRELHKEDYTLSNRIAELLELIERGRNGYDPAKVPPIEPVVLKYVDPETRKKERFTGRPTAEAAARFVLDWAKTLISQGWKEADIIDAFRATLDTTDDEEDIITVKVDADAEEKPSKKKKMQVTNAQVVYRREYHIWDGDKLEVFKHWPKAKAFMDDTRNQVMTNLMKLVPFQEIRRRQCASCGLKLNDEIMTVRDGNKQAGTNYHLACWYLRVAPPCRIPIGMEVLNPKEGRFYVWHGTENTKNGGWQPKAPAVKQGGSPAALSGSGDQDTPAPLQAEVSA